MSRYIDADALRDFLKIGEDCDDCEYCHLWMCRDELDTRDVCDAIEAAPTVDAVQVVRCKDCKHKHNYSAMGCCNTYYQHTKYETREYADNFYCADGEPK